MIIGGLAELFSGAISMGLGAYLAAVTDRDHYFSEERREREEVVQKPEAEKEECREVLEKYGVSREAAAMVVKDLCKDHDMWVKFMMDFELRLEKPDVNRAWISAATMGVAYFIGLSHPVLFGYLPLLDCSIRLVAESGFLGGLIPMIPYFAMQNVTHALFVSIGITVVILLGFGYIKNWVTVRTKRSAAYGALQTLFVGALAAGASYGIVKAIDSTNKSGVLAA